MPRTRSIKPEFWSDEKLAKVSRESRLTYAGLWGTSDDHGVTKGSVAWLRSQLYPYDEDLKLSKVEEWLGQLQNIGRIIPFDHNGEKYYYLPKFKTHQKVDHPSKARNPSPPENIESSDTRDALAKDSRDSHDETETETDTETETVVQYLNEKTGKHFRANGKQSSFIRARLKEGATVEDCKRVIDIKTSDWLNDAKWSQYLRPATLFNSEKFEGYLNSQSNAVDDGPRGKLLVADDGD